MKKSNSRIIKGAVWGFIVGVGLMVVSVLGMLVQAVGYFKGYEIGRFLGVGIGLALFSYVIAFIASVRVDCICGQCREED